MGAGCQSDFRGSEFGFGRKVTPTPLDVPCRLAEPRSGIIGSVHFPERAWL